ncbi:DEAD/DEAH box helicase family protein [Candidatus Poribacteria bacterium]|nr:DEAD/DEAH box helicase family protein [Candidatus Poribacteria bacterium]
MNNPVFTSGDQVQHDRFGIGSVVLDNGETVIIRFGHGLEECEKSSLSRRLTPLQAISLDEWNAPLEVITRAQAEAIQSVNDAWGVFSPSRIALLPHQLWVCRRVLETWPTRWLIADDVGLGKTIEAGLILWPLLAKGTVKRLLILCPASLVEQWQYRLRTMFDIRLAQYAAEADTKRGDFWNTHNQVVASLQTLRLDRNGRHNRLLESHRWDVLIVDEAHHLNADEKSGPTLGYKLVEQLVEERRVVSMLFFTGTPHRGKNFGFLSLLRLLKPDQFDPHGSLRAHLPKLRDVMIRNNKQNVTDLKGRRLFYLPIVKSETYSYSKQEARFYDMLTDFIATGKAYASKLSSTDGRAVILVLIAMQKLASSSVAAIRRALKGRLARIVEGKQDLKDLKSRVSIYETLEQDGDIDEVSRLEEQIAELSAALRLMEDEEPRLHELIVKAEAVKEETKVQKILSIIESRFTNRTVLLFTEYKATQSLLMSALMRKFGDECVTFINGDNRADEVVDSSGAVRKIFEKRESATEKFNSGGVQFLISTEAGGEGIDLQEQCHTLIHVDLPWNPMRLHQRVGRLNRYGQRQPVEVVTLRNPDTVESLIWEKLNAKINPIMLAFSHAMEEPEDLFQLVLGMTSPSLFREIFHEAVAIPRASLSEWFDQKTARFGGVDVIEAVSDLVGHCAMFDFQQVSSQIPPLDLPALRPFFVSMLTLNNRRPLRGISFKTPDAWRVEPGVRTSYEGMVFDRDAHGRDAPQRILGVGHKVMNQAMRQAKESHAAVVTLPPEVLEHPLVVFRISDRVTGESGTIRAVVVGIEWGIEAEAKVNLLRDWELLERLNGLDMSRDVRNAKTSPPPKSIDEVHTVVEHASFIIEQHLESLNLPFRLPIIETMTVLWPVSDV